MYINVLLLLSNIILSNVFDDVTRSMNDTYYFQTLSVISVKINLTVIGWLPVLHNSTRLLHVA